MDEMQGKPVSQITITFGGSDNMAPSLTGSSLSPAQWACVVALVSIMSQSSWAQAIAQAQATGIVRAPAGAIPGLGQGAIINREGRRHG